MADSSYHLDPSAVHVCYSRDVQPTSQPDIHEDETAAAAAEASRPAADTPPNEDLGEDLGDELGLQTHFFAPTAGDDALVDDEPPEVTRGFKPHGLCESPIEQLDFGLDWFELTAPEGGVNEVVQALSDALSCEPEDFHKAERGTYGYQDMLLGPGGSRVLYNSGGEREDVHFTLPGKAMASIPLERLERLAIEAVARDWKATRLDLRFDDQHRRVSVEEFARYCMDSDRRVSKVRHWHYHQSGEFGKARRKPAKPVERVHDKGWGTPLTGETFYLGSPKAERRLRYYDKGLESVNADTPIDANRLEFQVRDESAQALLGLLVARVGQWSEVAISWVVGFLDFREPETYRSHKERRERSPWWASIVGFFKGLRYFRAKPIGSVEKTLSWIDRQVSPSLGMSLLALGREGFISLMLLMAEDGERRMTPKQWAMLPTGGLA